MTAAAPSDPARRSPARVRPSAEDFALLPTGPVRRMHGAGRYRWVLAIAACAMFLSFVPLIEQGGDVMTPFLIRYFAANVPLVMVGAAAASLSLLAVALWMHVIDLRSSIARLATAIEMQGAGDERTPLPLRGPFSVLQLTRAINLTRRRHAGRLAQLLDVQAAYAYDLRTPLIRMGIRCETLDDPALRRSLNRDLAEMKELVDASTACARMQCSVEEPPERVDADALLVSLIDDYRDAGHCIELDGEVGHAVVTCPHALRRVLVNLIDNALRYGSGVSLNVRVEARALIFAVRDNGPGIEPSQMEAVFAPWYRAPHTAARAPGSGLGLAIARRLALAMHGDLQLENCRTGGLEARLRLPLVIA
jgi:signal transduction histidine kinase